MHQPQAPRVYFRGLGFGAGIFAGAMMGESGTIA
jgi:hypothetical protein